MCGAGLSSDLRDLTCFAQAGGQKNLGQDPALREKRDPESQKSIKGGQYASQKLESAFLAVSVGSDCRARKTSVQCVV